MPPRKYSIAYAYKRFGIAERVLGHGYAQWRVEALQNVLEHYGVSDTDVGEKIDLIQGLHLVVDYFGLHDQREIYDLAHAKNSEPLPDLTRPPLNLSLNDLLEDKLPSVNRWRPEDKRQGKTPPQWSALERRESIIAQLKESGGPHTCTVCLDIIEDVNDIVSKVSGICRHKNDICQRCLSQSITVQFENKMWSQISCPVCGIRLSSEDVNKHGDIATKARYSDLQFEQWKVSNSDEHFQLCRQPGCDYGAQIIPEVTSYLICGKCNGRTCIECDAAWHTGLTCRGYQERKPTVKGQQIKKQRDEEEKAGVAYVAEKSKICPECKSPGEKVSGCDHISCPRCGHQYCYICLASYAEIFRHGNDRHRKSCQHYRPPAAPRPPPQQPLRPLPQHNLPITPLIPPPAAGANPPVVRPPLAYQHAGNAAHQHGNAQRGGYNLPGPSDRQELVNAFLQVTPLPPIPRQPLRRQNAPR